MRKKLIKGALKSFAKKKIQEKFAKHSIGILEHLLPPISNSDLVRLTIFSIVMLILSSLVIWALLAWGVWWPVTLPFGFLGLYFLSQAVGWFKYYLKRKKEKE